MKVIFLDFDGVITLPPKWTLCSSKIKLVKHIVDQTDAKIVVSSSWRHNLDNDFKIELKEKPNDEMIIWLQDNVYDITPVFSRRTCRGDEIQQWLNAHKDVENYVIIDDDADMLDSQLYHFIQTNFEDGLTETEVIRAIKILNREFFFNSIALNFKLRYEYLKKCDNLPNKFNELTKYNDLCQNYKLNKK